MATKMNIWPVMNCKNQLRFITCICMYIYIPVYEEFFMSYMCDFISSWSNCMRKLSQCDSKIVGLVLCEECLYLRELGVIETL